MKVILIETNPELVLDKTISLLTNTNYRHACIMFPTYTGSVLFESTLIKGGVVPYRHFEHLGDSKIVLYDIPVETVLTWKDAFRFALSKIGYKYDLAGFLLWCFNRNTPGKLYCFEYVLNSLGKLGSINNIPLMPMVHLMRGTSISGSDIENILHECKLVPTFKGKARDYNLDLAGF